jgi:hypothetical protein
MLHMIQNSFSNVAAIGLTFCATVGLYFFLMITLARVANTCATTLLSGVCCMCFFCFFFNSQHPVMLMVSGTLHTSVTSQTHLGHPSDPNPFQNTFTLQDTLCSMHDQAHLRHLSDLNPFHACSDTPWTPSSFQTTPCRCIC